MHLCAVELGANAAHELLQLLDGFTDVEDDFGFHVVLHCAFNVLQWHLEETIELWVREVAKGMHGRCRFSVGLPSGAELIHWCVRV